MRQFLKELTIAVGLFTAVVYGMGYSGMVLSQTTVYQVITK